MDGCCERVAYGPDAGWVLTIVWGRVSEADKERSIKITAHHHTPEAIHVGTVQPSGVAQP